MAGYVNVDGYRRDHYLARSWALLTQEKGWWKPVLLMGLACLVPIVGPLAVFGYQLEWSRLIAWNVNAAPRRHDVRVGECLASGWRGFLVWIGWSFLYWCIGAALGHFLVIGNTLHIVWNVMGIFISMAIMAACIRATIYQKAGAGYRVKPLWEMAKHDPEGLARVWLISLLGDILCFLVAVAIIVPSFLSIVPTVFYQLSYMYEYSSVITSSAATYMLIDLVYNVVCSMGGAFLIVFAVDCVVYAMFNLLVSCALGLWMRQFNVPAWGKDEDPLPDFVDDPRDEKDVPEAPELQAAAPVVEPEPVVQPEPVVESGSAAAPDSVPAEQTSNDEEPSSGDVQES